MLCIICFIYFVCRFVFAILMNSLSFAEMGVSVIEDLLFRCVYCFLSSSKLLFSKQRTRSD